MAPGRQLQVVEIWILYPWLHRWVYSCTSIPLALFIEKHTHVPSIYIDCCGSEVHLYLFLQFFQEFAVATCIPHQSKPAGYCTLLLQYVTEVGGRP